MIYKTPPWNHQKKDVDRIHKEHIKSFALFYDMGAGKTKTAIDIARSIYLRHDRLLKTLIICPIVVVENWKREFLTHSNVPAAAIQVVDGKSKPNGKKVKTAQLKLKLEQLNNSSASIFIINTESVGNKNLWPLIEAMGFEVLIVDESHRFKSPSATRTKALHRLTNQGQLEYRYILTGSPILQDALDLWSQFFILNPSILGYNYFSFRSQYFYDANASMPAHVHFPKFIPKDEAYYKKLKLPYNDDFATLNKIIYRHASRVMKDDVLDLPPFVTQKIEVEFTKEQSRIYEEMRKDLVATLDTKEELYTFEHNNFLDIAEAEVMSADLAIVKTLRLMQIAAGIFTNEDGDVKEIKENRSKILKELLEEITANKENKVIVWSCFTPTYGVIEKVCEELGIKYTWLTGRQDKDEKQANVDQFNTDKDTQVIIANQGAGGTGVNLTASNYSIYYSRSFNLEHDIQSEARNYRGGQNRKVTRIDLVTPDTIDAAIVEALAKKKEGAENILEVKSLEREEILELI